MGAWGRYWKGVQGVGAGDALGEYLEWVLGVDERVGSWKLEPEAGVYLGRELGVGWVPGGLWEAVGPYWEVRAGPLHRQWDSDRRDKRPHSLGQCQEALCPPPRPRHPLNGCSQLPVHSRGQCGEVETRERRSRRSQIASPSPAALLCTAQANTSGTCAGTEPSGGGGCHRPG